MFRIPAAREKRNKDRLLPMAPEFAELLEGVPIENRVGFVFEPRPRKRVLESLLSLDYVGLNIAAIGKRANVAVQQLDNGKVRYVTAHDLRRSFDQSC